MNLDRQLFLFNVLILFTIIFSIILIFHILVFKILYKNFAYLILIILIRETYYKVIYVSVL